MVSPMASVVLGSTTMLCNALTESVDWPEIVPTEALTTLVPLPAPVASPPVATVATAVVAELQLAEEETSAVCPSE